jgi:hypothetical protein
MVSSASAVPASAKGDGVPVVEYTGTPPEED